MGTTIYRCTGIGLALTIALLGVTVSLLLYYAGQAGVELFFTKSTYTDDHHRINRRMPTDTWYGELILRGWAFGFVYIIPGLSGITASLFFNKALMIVHVTIAILSLFIGSFLHTGGGIAIGMYRILVVEGASRYNPFLGDCIYVRDDDAVPYDYIDERCLEGRKALTLSLAAIGVMVVAWVFVLSNLLYIGFTFHNIGPVKAKKEDIRLEPVRRPRRRPNSRRNEPGPSTSGVASGASQPVTTHPSPTVTLPIRKSSNTDDPAVVSDTVKTEAHELEPIRKASDEAQKPTIEAAEDVPKQVYPDIPSSFEANGAETPSIDAKDKLQTNDTVPLISDDESSVVLDMTQDKGIENSAYM